MEKKIFGKEKSDLSDPQKATLRIARGILSTEGNFALIDDKGSLIVDFRFEDIEDFQDERALVKLYLSSPIFGFVNKNGNVSRVFQHYTNISSFHEGLALVELNNKPKFGFIDKYYNVTIPIIYEGARGFKNGLAAVCKYDSGIYGKWGFIDKAGKQLIPFTYDEVGDFYDGLAYVKQET